MPALDFRTLVVCASATAACILAVLVLVRAVRPVPAGFGAWTLSQLLVAPGTALIAFRGGALPDWAGIWLGDVLFLAALAAQAEGFVRFHGVRRRSPAWLDGGLLLASAILIAVWMHRSVNLRSVVFSSVSAWFLLRTSLEPLASAEARSSRAQRAASLITLAAALPLLLRAGWAAWGGRFPELSREGWTVLVPAILLTLVNVTSMFIALLLCFERSESQLRTARSEVKILSGLLPICMHCHRIRNDQGYWDRLERFIGEHSEARFSHGLCPTCYDKMFGGGTTPQQRPG